MQKISAAGLELIAKFEGFRAETYIGPAGNDVTIGYGHFLHWGTLTAADRRMRWSQAHALRVLDRDADIAEAAVRRLVKVKLNQNQFDALVSFTFNCGTGALASSTLLKVLNDGKYDQVPAQLMRWTKAGGQELRGLVIRRGAEAALWSKSDDPLDVLTATERAWVREYDRLRKLNRRRGDACDRRLRELRRLMRKRRKAIYLGAKRHGWDKRHRKQRWRILYRRTR